MNIFPFFQSVLYTISTALLYPVVIVIIFLCFWMILYAGGFLAEWVKRKQYNTNLADFMNIIYQKKSLPLEIEKNLPVHVNFYAEKLSNIVCSENFFKEEQIEDMIQKQENSLIREVDKIRMIVRIGPSLGLMGTLIPMGTGLASLTKGNMAQLSSSLILAFTTTVVGLALGVSAHVFSITKERWAADDIRHIQLITEAMTKTSRNQNEIFEKKSHNPTVLHKAG